MMRPLVSAPGRVLHRAERCEGAGARAEMDSGNARATNGPFLEGDNVLLLDGQGRQTLVTLRPGRRVHSHRGTLDLDDLIGRDEGSALRSSTGDRVLAFRPRLMDYALEMPRSTGLIYPKDAAFILLWA